MFKVFLLQSLFWLYDPLISLLLQAVAQVSLFKSGMSNSRPAGRMRPSELSNPALEHPSIIVIFCKVFQFFRININNCHNEMQKIGM